MRKLWIKTVSGVIIVGLALAGLLSAVDLISNAKPEDHSQVNSPQNPPYISDHEVSTSLKPAPSNYIDKSPSPSINRLTPLTTPFLSHSTGEEASSPCPACSGNKSHGRGNCPICGGTGLAGLADKMAQTISPEGSLLPHIPILNLNGITGSSLLRSFATSVYDAGLWKMDINAESLPYLEHTLVPPVSKYSGSMSNFMTITPVVSADEGSYLLPTCLYPLELFSDSSLEFFPEEQQFISLDGIPESYSFEYVDFSFAEEILRAAEIDEQQGYIELPEDCTQRILDLAEEITGGIESPYLEATAIEQYLRENYSYNFDYERAPDGQSPDDWFLFEEKEGVCANFNSAFVTLSRASGLPARLVCGYMVEPGVDEQTVYADQAHAWSEVKFQDLGWVAFDATPPAASSLDSRNVIFSTVTDIVEAVSPVYKGHKFFVIGTVSSPEKAELNGLVVEVFINKQKQPNGGIKIGKGKVSSGIFNIEAIVPEDADVGDYQLLAHCLGGIKYSDSWSDPPVTVVTKTEISLSGDRQVKLSEQTRISGILAEESGAVLGNRDIDIYLGDSFVSGTTTDETGKFVVYQSFNQPGDYLLEARFSGTDYYLSSSATLSVQALIPTLIYLEILQECKTGDSVLVQGSLLEENGGTPVGNREISLLIDGILDKKLMTDENGEFKTVTSFKSKEVHKVEAKYTSFPFHYESSTIRHVNVISAPASFKWFYIPIAFCLAVAGPGGFLFFQRRRKKIPMKGQEKDDVAENRIDPVEQPDQKTQTSLVIEFPQIEPELPDVWGEGEELEVVCLLQDDQGVPMPQKKLNFYIGNSANHLNTDSRGNGHLKCTFQKKGRYQLSAKYTSESDEGNAETKKVIKIVDYREEIVEIFRELLVWVRTSGINLPARATPREVKQILLDSKTSVPEQALELVIAIFEEADYSLHPVTRENYKKMFMAQMDLKKSGKTSTEDDQR